MKIDIGQVIAILVGLIIGDCLYFGMKKIIGRCKKKHSDFQKKYFDK